MIYERPKGKPGATELIIPAYRNRRKADTIIREAYVLENLAKVTCLERMQKREQKEGLCGDSKRGCRGLRKDEMAGREFSKPFCKSVCEDIQELKELALTKEQHALLPACMEGDEEAVADEPYDSGSDGEMAGSPPERQVSSNYDEANQTECC